MNYAVGMNIYEIVYWSTVLCLCFRGNLYVKGDDYIGYEFKNTFGIVCVLLTRKPISNSNSLVFNNYRMIS